MEMQDRFKSSEAVGMFIAAIGWIVVAIGVISALVQFAGHSDLKVITGSLSLIGGIVLGAQLIVQGQMIQCLIKIEHHTKRSADKLAGREDADALQQSGGDWYQKGLDLAAQNRYGEAVEAYNRALVDKPNDADLWLYKGFALGELGRWDEAISAYDQAITIQPRSADAFFNRAGVYARKGNKSAALKDLTKAITLDDSNKSSAVEDEDFRSLWDDDDFKKIVGE